MGGRLGFSLAGGWKLFLTGVRPAGQKSFSSLGLFLCVLCALAVQFSFLSLTRWSASLQARRRGRERIEPQRRPDEILDREERSREPDRLISWGRREGR